MPALKKYYHKTNNFNSNLIHESRFTKVAGIPTIFIGNLIDTFNNIDLTNMLNTLPDLDLTNLGNTVSFFLNSKLNTDQYFFLTYNSMNSLLIEYDSAWSNKDLIRFFNTCNYIHKIELFFLLPV